MLAQFRRTFSSEALQLLSSAALAMLSPANPRENTAVDARGKVEANRQKPPARLDSDGGIAQANGSAKSEPEREPAPILDCRHEYDEKPEPNIAQADNVRE